MSDAPVILICNDVVTGRVRGVGLYETEALARDEVRRAHAPDKLFSLWTPRLNDWVASGTVE